MNPHSLFHAVTQDKAPDELKLIVEIAQGDSNKYEYNGELGVLELDRVLFGPNFYPVNYCDIPQTFNHGDNDPLDAVLFSTYPIQAGVLATGRVIGMMEMDDNNETDNKIICVNSKDPRFAHVNDINDLTEYQKKDLQTFMETYKIPQSGPGTVKVGAFLPKSSATPLIQDCLAAYKAKYNK